MATERKFCRFNKRGSISLGRMDSTGLTTREVPDDGMCLSAFLVIVQRENSNSVLMGHLDPSAHWDHIGALDEARVKMNEHGWMLPSSHLIIHESPQDAAMRITREQLELPRLRLEDPKVISEVYASPRFPELKTHWDFEFIFKSTLGKDEVPIAQAWRELKFIDLPSTSKADIARSHEDIIEAAGLRFRPD